MEIFNRTPTISEDTLQYTLHLPPDLSDKVSALTFAACIQSFAETLLPGFIWHRDAFELKAILDQDIDQWILEGRMRVGDCVDDEWCTVWLLKEISSKWDVAISVFDSDGEFLLIEAADALPSWVTPTNSENRVWIHSSRLHLIHISHISPPSRKRRHRKLPGATDDDDDDGDSYMKSDNNDEFISIEDSLQLVRDPSVETWAPPSVEKLVWQRISGYPAATLSHTHITKAHIPIDIAKVLSVNPHLVQKAVETFYTRDAIQLRAAHRMSRFPPNSSVLSTVKLTRTAYAQLVGQKFFPPKIFGRWQEREGTNEWRWRDVGMKIAVGFEILYQEGKSRKDTFIASAETSQSSMNANKEALRRNPDYIEYIRNLTSAGYFKGEIEGSELWRELESKATATFLDVRREDDASRKSFAALVTTALSQTADFNVSVIQADEDNDDWLNVNAQDFDNMLEKSMGAPSGKAQSATDFMDVNESEEKETTEDRLASEQASRLQKLAAKVEDFVEGEGDLEGARFDDDELSDELFSDEDMSSGSDNESEQENVVARQAAMDKLVPGLDASEYGQMPASFHTKSQRVAPTTVATDIIEDIEPGQKPHAPEQAPETKARPIRQPIIPRDTYDGVDSDDETDEDEGDDEGESDEERPQVVGDIEPDMDEEEGEFLEFSRQALGISDAQWEEIIRDRKERGAFVPASEASKHQTSHKPSAPDPATSHKMNTPDRKPAPGPRPSVNPNLDSFEAVMKAMDEELARSRPSKKAAPSQSSSSDKTKGKGKAPAIDEEGDIEAAMDAELAAALENDGDEEDGEEPMDYNMIKNFLESFKSQAGLSGPVSNLAGRLDPGWKLPRDDS